MNKRIKTFLLTGLMLVFLAGCGSREPQAQIAATTAPVYDFTMRLCQGTGLTVTRLVTEQVSCLHDYSLNVRQVKAAEAAEVVVISGAGLEEFLEGVIDTGKAIDASQGISLLCPEEAHEHEHDHEHDHDHGHHHEEDPHIWLSPANAKIMAANICAGLSQAYPEHTTAFAANLEALTAQLDQLEAYGKEALSDLSCRELITFHDGFAYLAEGFGLTILEAVEEESGSEASAQDLKHLIEQVEHHHLPAIFTEVSGSDSAARVIARETGASIYALDMAMAGDSYFDAMYHNIDTLKEALG